jgi:putative restriction endonuclease
VSYVTVPSVMAGPVLNFPVRRCSIDVVDDPDLAVRLAAFDFLTEAVAAHGEVLPRGILSAGFLHHDRRVPLVGPQGIFKPAVMRDMPLSITTAPRGPYDDDIRDDDRITYRYRGSNPDHHENRGLRRAMETETPLIYFYGLVPGQYFTAWPVYIVGDDRENLSFTVVHDAQHAIVDTTREPAAVAGRRAYVTGLTRRRLHQAGFRQRVIEAYRRMCGVCRLRHAELLDAAHILPDARGGAPVVTNGISLCKLHHAAFDQNILGIRPDLMIEINRRVLDEIDGPMLLHGLQGFHRSPLTVPRPRQLRPDAVLLEQRYEVFRAS